MRRRNDARLATANFDLSPFTLAWEITRACALACLHCRAQAQPKPDPNQLTTAEAMSVVDQIRDMGDPILVITGGDPLMRRDVYDILTYAAGHGLRTSLTPSATALVTPKNLARVRESGVVRVAISLDGPTPETHDAFRRVRGSYAWTMRIVETTIALGLPLQINSTVSRMTLPHLVEMARLVSSLPVTLWALFFLIQTGRGVSLEQVTTTECERVLDYLYDLSQTSPFGIKTTEAPHYQRVVWQRDRLRQAQGLRRPSVERSRQLRAPRGVTDGNGFVFIDHVGAICPSGFLPVNAGNIRQRSLASMYQDSEPFKQLRRPGEFKGVCGICEFNIICGGSRSRAYALTGDYLESDPWCVYRPSAKHADSKAESRQRVD